MRVLEWLGYAGIRARRGRNKQEYGPGRAVYEGGQRVPILFLSWGERLLCAR
jgi:hypothetical protein